MNYYFYEKIFMDHIITIRTSKELKKAIKLAAINSGFANTSSFILGVLSVHKNVAKEMKKNSKKDLAE